MEMLVNDGVNVKGLFFGGGLPTCRGVCMSCSTGSDRRSAALDLIWTVVRGDGPGDKEVPKV